MSTIQSFILQCYERNVAFKHLCTGLQIVFFSYICICDCYISDYICCFTPMVVGLNLTCSPQVTTVRESTAQTADSDVLVRAPSSSIWGFDLVVCNITQCYVEINQPNALRLYLSLFFSHNGSYMFWLSSLYTYSTPVCRFRHMVLDLSATKWPRTWLRQENRRSLRMALFCRNM
jgi:hypothetical protein